MNVPAGKTVRISVTNHDATEHDMLMQGLQIDKAGEATGTRHAGATLNMLVVRLMRTATAASRFCTDQKGTFSFICTVPGHEDAGMVGTMTVSRWSPILRRLVVGS